MTKPSQDPASQDPVAASGRVVPAPSSQASGARRQPEAQSHTAGTGRRRTSAAASRRRGLRRMTVGGCEQDVIVDLDESPLAWLARRTGKAGRPMISDAQFLAGERLRVDFTRAGLTPRVTTNWSAMGASGGSGPAAFTDAVLEAKARLSAALSAVGPELSGVLLDVCCFLKGLEAVEGEREWPARTAKVVLGLGLERLARHYGLSAETQGTGGGATRAWRASEAPSPLDG